MNVTSLQDAIRYTGVSLPYNYNSFPADVRAYIALRIINSAIDQEEVDSITIENGACYPLFNESGKLCRFGEFSTYPGGEFLLTFYCASKIYLKTLEGAKYCASNFKDYWLQLVTENSIEMSLPSNIESLLPDVQTYIRLRIASRNLNGGGGGNFFPFIDFKHDSPQVTKWAFLNVPNTFGYMSLTNLGLRTKELAQTSANTQESLWKQFAGINI